MLYLQMWWKASVPPALGKRLLGNLLDLLLGCQQELQLGGQEELQLGGHLEHLLKSQQELLLGCRIRHLMEPPLEVNKSICLEVILSFWWRPRKWIHLVDRSAHGLSSQLAQVLLLLLLILKQSKFEILRGWKLEIWGVETFTWLPWPWEARWLEYLVSSPPESAIPYLASDISPYLASVAVSPKYLFCSPWKGTCAVAGWVVGYPVDSSELYSWERCAEEEEVEDGQGEEEEDDWPTMPRLSFTLEPASGHVWGRAIDLFVAPIWGWTFGGKKGSFHYSSDLGCWVILACWHLVLTMMSINNQE